MDENIVSVEEADQLSRSTTKIKRVGVSDELEDIDMDAGNAQDMADMDMDSLQSADSKEKERGRVPSSSRLSYRDMVQQNNPNLNFTAMTNPMWEDLEDDFDSGDDEPALDDDPLCPTISLTAEEKKHLRSPWKNALILTTLDKVIGYMQLKRRLKVKWALKGDFSLIDIGCDYYVTRFTNLGDYEHVPRKVLGCWEITILSSGNGFPTSSRKRIILPVSLPGYESLDLVLSILTNLFYWRRLGRRLVMIPQPMLSMVNIQDYVWMSI